MPKASRLTLCERPFGCDDVFLTTRLALIANEPPFSTSDANLTRCRCEEELEETKTSSGIELRSDIDARSEDVTDGGGGGGRLKTLERPGKVVFERSFAVEEEAEKTGSGDVIPEKRISGIVLERASGGMELEKVLEMLSRPVEWNWFC